MSSRFRHATATPTSWDEALSTLRTLLPYLWPQGAWGMRLRVVIAMSFLLLAKVAAVYIPLFYKEAVDTLDAAPDALTIPLAAILAYGAARVMSLAFAELRDAVFARVAQRAIRNAALGVFRHLHQLSLRFHLERQTGGLSRVIERGTKAIESLLSFMLFNILPTLLEIALTSAILWWMFGWSYALVTLLTLVGYIMFTAWVTEWRMDFRRQMNDSDQQAHTRAIDSLINFETVKYFGNERHEAARFEQAMSAYEEAAVRSKVSLSALNIGQTLIVAIGLSSIMYMAAGGIVAGEMTLGDFVLVNTYLMQLAQPLNFFGVVYRVIRQGLVDMEAMFTLLGAPREIVDQPDAPTLHVQQGTIEFCDVHFGYDPRRPVLHGVSFRVEAGQTLAIVGATGSGKSTIGRLMYRFYDVDEGAILIDGQDLRHVAQDSLRAAIGVVPQDTVLFNEDIYYNIAYGRPEASPTEIEQAARTAHIHDFIMQLPDGYRSRVGERGLKLSGGEKQRVAIARTVLKHPALLLFDEATSALDTHTERELQANLRELSRGHTTVVIAHRLSTVIEADQIIVLDQGRIAERGNHSTLLAAEGLYARLWHSQQQRRSADDTPHPAAP